MKFLLEFSSDISDLNDISVAIRYCLCCLNGIIFGHYWVNLDIRRSTVKLKLRWWVLFARCNYDKPLAPSLSPVWCDRGVAGTGIWHRRPDGASSHQPCLITNTPASPYIGLDIVDTGKMNELFLAILQFT